MSLLHNAVYLLHGKRLLRSIVALSVLGSSINKAESQEK
jgi:multisubunit Na+/H+ antiporter MnhC subunit